MPTPPDQPAPSDGVAAPSSGGGRRWLVWADAERLPPLADLFDRLGEAVRVVGVGGSRATAVTRFAATHDAEQNDDLRALLASTDADGLLIASADGVAASDLAFAADAGLELRATELPLTSLSELRDALGVDGGPKGESPLVLTPAIASLPGLSRANDPMHVIGDARAIAVRHVGPARTGTVWTRLVDAWLAVITLGALPETIDATLRTPAARQPDDPLAVHGTVLAHGRGIKAAASTVAVSDQLFATRRRVDVFAADGYLELTDHAFLLFGPGDPPIDGTPDPHQPADPVDLLDAHWTQLDDPTPSDARPRLARLREAVACGLATLLSTRTGQPESPHNLLRLDR
jgi:hypothetical protein